MTDTRAIWHDERGNAFELVDQVVVSSPRTRKVKKDGRMVTESLPPLEYTICTAMRRPEA